MKLVVEISDKHNQRIERHVLKKAGLSFGRAWDNDVIVQDKFVDADHLHLTLADSGQIEIRDLETTNGSHVGHKRIKANAKLYRLGDPIRIGDTTLRVFDASIAVEKTALRSAWYFLQERLSSWPSLITLTLFAVSLVVVDSALLNADVYKLSSVLVGAAFTLLLLLFWSIGLGLISKLARGESNLRMHWALACLSVIVVFVISVLLVILRFNIQAPEIGRALQVFVMAIIGGALLFAVLTYATHLSSRTKSITALFVALSLIASSYSALLLREPKQRWSSQTNTESSNLPPVFLWRSEVNLDQYMNETADLFNTGE